MFLYIMYMDNNIVENDNKLFKICKYEMKIYQQDALDQKEECAKNVC